MLNFKPKILTGTTKIWTNFELIQPKCMITITTLRGLLRWWLEKSNKNTRRQRSNQKIYSTPIERLYSHVICFLVMIHVHSQDFVVVVVVTFLQRGKEMRSNWNNSRGGRGLLHNVIISYRAKTAVFFCLFIKD